VNTNFTNRLTKVYKDNKRLNLNSLPKNDIFVFASQSSIDPTYKLEELRHTILNFCDYVEEKPASASFLAIE